MEAKEEDQALLLKASAEGDVATVHALLERGGLDVNGRDAERRTALQTAASNGHLAVVKTLLTAGADPNTRGMFSQTPLHVAASNGHLAAVEVLLKAGADLDARDKDGQTSLHVAASNGYLAVVEMLLKDVADLNAWNWNQQTPLEMASAKGHLAVVKILLKAVDMEEKKKKKKKDQKLLLEASKEGDVATVRELLESGDLDVNAVDEERRTPLHMAASNGYLAVVEMMLEAGADPNARDDKDEQTSLHMAASKGHLAVVEMLLKGNADPNIRDRYKRTPLDIASSNDHVQVVEILLKADEVEGKKWKDQKLLREASKEGDVATVRRLLERGDLDVNSVDEERRTPLYMAASNGHLAVVKMLLKASAHLNTPNRNLRTPLYIAACKGHLAVVETLLKAGADPNPRHIESNRKFTYGPTPLRAACARHRGDIVRALLASGADACSIVGRHKPFHLLIEAYRRVKVSNETLLTLQQLVAFGATWDDTCDEMIAKGRARPEAPALRICALLWAQEYADGRPMTYVLIEVVKRGAKNTQAYIDEIKSSREIVLRRKVCVVGAGCSGKTSFVKSITTQTPQLEEVKTRIIEYSTPRRPRLEEVDDRKIGIDLFPLRFEQEVPSRNEKNIHEVTFWDFTGHDAYQVADSLFFSPRTLILVFMDLNAFAIAYMQAAIFANEDFQEPRLLREYVEHAVLRWVRMILRHQPAAEFAFIATKDDAVNGNPITETLLKDELRSQLKTVGAVVQEMTAGKKSTFAIPEMQDGVIFVSCTSEESVLEARSQLEALISSSDRSAPMPDTYTQALQSIVATRDAAKSDIITTRIERIFAPVETLPEKLQIESGLCCMILQTLHDLGDVLWYEDLDVGILRQTVILEPMLMIDFIREIFDCKHTGLTISHCHLRSRPLWSGLPPSDSSLMEALKKLLQCFKLAYSTAGDHIMAWDSHLIVPAQVEGVEQCLGRPRARA